MMIESLYRRFRILSPAPQFSYVLIYTSAELHRNYLEDSAEVVNSVHILQSKIMASTDSETLELTDLPNEVQLLIFDNLNFKERLTVSEVCRLWHLLAFSGRFMSGISLCMRLKPRNSGLVLSTVASNRRNYRHIGIDFWDHQVKDIESLAQTLGGNESLESLALMGLEAVEPAQLSLLLSNTPDLARLYLIGDLIVLNKLRRKSSELLFELPGPIGNMIDARTFLRSSPGSTWMNFFEGDDQVVLRKLRNLCIVSSKMSPTARISSLVRLCPSITQLQLTSNHHMYEEVYHTYRNQLEKLVVLSPTVLFSFCFCIIGFPKLTYLYLDRLELHDEHLVDNFTDFFKNQTNNIQQLILHSGFMIRTTIFTSICNHCTALRVLELSLDYMDGDALKDITKLSNLEKLSLHGTAYFRDTPHWPYHISTLKEVNISASRFLTPLLEFIADIAPNLKSLGLEDLPSPDEAFQCIPKLLGDIYHLQIGYSNKYDRPPSCHPSGLLRTMVNLETYRLRRVPIRHGIQGWLQDAPGLKKISLENCNSLTDTHLVILTTNCPRLMQLELTQCLAISPRGLAEFRSRIPACRVVCDTEGEPQLDETMRSEIDVMLR